MNFLKLVYEIDDLLHIYTGVSGRKWQNTEFVLILCVSTWVLKSEKIKSPHPLNSLDGGSSVAESMTAVFEIQLADKQI